MINIDTEDISQENYPVFRIVDKEPLWAKIVSLALHPLLMMTYGIALLFLFTDFGYLLEGRFLRFMAPILFLTCGIPASLIYTLKRMGIISDYDVTNRKERFIPFIIVFFCYGVLFYSFAKQQNLPIWFLAMLLAPILILIIGVIINIFWKISAHMLGIGCLIGSVLSLCYNIKEINPYLLFIILFILAGILGVSRLILKRHTATQVYVGFLLGVAVSCACIWVGGNFAYIYLYYLNNF